VLSEIDDLMEERALDALLCYGDTTLGNPELAYLTRTSLPRGGVYLRKADGESVLVVSNLDLERARKGVVKNVQTYADYGYLQLAKSYGRQRAFTEFVAGLLRRFRVKGRVAISGRNDVCKAVRLADRLRRKGYAVVGELGPTVIDEARRTKDDWEVSALEDTAKKTLTVIAKVEELLLNLRLRNGSAWYEGQQATIGWVKSRVRVWCAELALSLPENLIFAQGPSSADPHTEGIDSNQLKEGEPIVFDIFPQGEAGYWSDFTRTYVLGRPSPQVAEMYRQVVEAQQIALDHIVERAPSEEPMLKTCAYFRSRGRLTLLDVAGGNREAERRGFTHGLGHGVGLTIGEEPYLTLYDKQPLLGGMVATVEPGLYDPEVGGVRVEDIVVVQKGRPRLLAEHPHRFEL